MISSCLYSVVILIFGVHLTNSGPIEIFQTNIEKLWADAAYEYLVNLDCKSGIFAGDECRYLVKKPKHKMNIYVASSSDEARLMAVLPDGELSHAGSHDAMVVIDPYPNVTFGHFVLAFFVDIDTSKIYCHHKAGIHLGKLSIRISF